MPTVKVLIRLKPSLLDSAGREVLDSLHALGFGGVKDVRMGKLIELETDDASQVEAMCKAILANPVIETYEIIED